MNCFYGFTFNEDEESSIFDIENITLSASESSPLNSDRCASSNMIGIPICEEPTGSTTQFPEQLRGQTKLADQGVRNSPVQSENNCCNAPETSFFNQPENAENLVRENPCLLSQNRSYKKMDHQKPSKNLKHSTAMLKLWLQKHNRNPYPNKKEKALLAVEANLSVTQISTWFANARRRLKKENKVTWNPRHRSNYIDASRLQHPCESEENQFEQNFVPITNLSIKAAENRPSETLWMPRASDDGTFNILEHYRNDTVACAKQRHAKLQYSNPFSNSSHEDANKFSQIGFNNTNLSEDSKLHQCQQYHFSNFEETFCPKTVYASNHNDCFFNATPAPHNLTLVSNNSEYFEYGAEYKTCRAIARRHSSYTRQCEPNWNRERFNSAGNYEDSNTCIDHSTNSAAIGNDSWMRSSGDIRDAPFSEYPSCLDVATFNH